MSSWKTAVVSAAMVAAGGVSAAFTPPAHSQTRAATPPRALDVLGGRGSQIGVSIRDVDAADAKTSGQAGVMVVDVTGDSPAQKAGIRNGDLVVEFDGERVRSVRQFTRIVQETPAGRKVQASLVRDGQKVNVVVEPRESSGFNLLGNFDGMRMLRDFGDALPVAPAPPAPPAAPGVPTPPAAPMYPDVQSFVWRSGNNGLGITVSDLSTQLAEYFGTKDGVLVTSVYADSAAAKAGIKAGDVVTSFNGSEVTDPSDLRRRTQRLGDGDEFTVTVVRDRKPLTLKGKKEAAQNRRTYRSEV